MKKKTIRKIGILTAGGDCPGLNAVIRAVTKTAVYHHGLEVFGIEDGYEGLLYKRGRALTSEDVSGILTHGGTILGTSNRCDPFRIPVTRSGKIIFEDQSENVLKHFREWQLDALIAVGGDGTLKIARRLYEKGIPIVGIPKTIDNDLCGTDFTFGFDTAVTIATDAVDRLHTTAASHHRVMILEVMGRNAGWIALFAGAAGGADIILIPEIPFDGKRICEEVKVRSQKGKRFSIIVAAEGAHTKGASPIVRTMDRKNPHPEKLGGIAGWLENKIVQGTEVETRSAVLGHIQRGGSPTPFDRNLGTMFGEHAVRLIMEKKWGRMVCFTQQKISSVSIQEAVHSLKKVPLNHDLITAAKAVGTSFGV